MHWQQDGELARADLDALVHALQQVECDYNSAELQRLGRDAAAQRCCNRTPPAEAHAQEHQDQPVPAHRPVANAWSGDREPTLEVQNLIFTI